MSAIDVRLVANESGAAALKGQDVLAVESFAAPVRWNFKVAKECERPGAPLGSHDSEWDPYLLHGAPRVMTPGEGGVS